jgi:hypothetical protein
MRFDSDQICDKVSPPYRVFVVRFIAFIHCDGNIAWKRKRVFGEHKGHVFSMENCLGCILTIVRQTYRSQDREGSCILVENALIFSRVASFINFLRGNLPLTLSLSASLSAPLICSAGHRTFFLIQPRLRHRDRNIAMSSCHKFQERTFTKLTYCDYCTKVKAQNSIDTERHRLMCRQHSNTHP